MVKDSIAKAEWLVTYPQKNPGTHSGQALQNVLEALVKSGLTAAACGTLGLGNQARLKAVIDDPLALHIAARMYWWNETPNEALDYVRRHHPEDIPE